MTHSDEAAPDAPRPTEEGRRTSSSWKHLGRMLVVEALGVLAGVIVYLARQGSTHDCGSVTSPTSLAALVAVAVGAVAAIVGHLRWTIRRGGMRGVDAATGLLLVLAPLVSFVVLYGWFVDCGE